MQRPVELAGGRKLSESQVQQIRDMFDGSWGFQTRVAKLFGVSQVMIGNIVRGDAWNDEGAKKRRARRRERAA
jgi:hypothetical protein